MLTLRVEYEKNYYRGLVKRLARVRRKAHIHIDVLVKNGLIYVIGLDDGLSATFLYSAYLKAKERGLKAGLYFAWYIDENWIPKEVKELGTKWVSGRLSRKEAERLKSIRFAEYIFERWCG